MIGQTLGHFKILDKLERVEWERCTGPRIRRSIGWWRSRSCLPSWLRARRGWIASLPQEPLSRIHLKRQILTLELHSFQGVRSVIENKWRKRMGTEVARDLGTSCAYWPLRASAQRAGSDSHATESESTSKTPRSYWLARTEIGGSAWESNPPPSPTPARDYGFEDRRDTTSHNTHQPRTVTNI